MQSALSSGGSYSICKTTQECASDTEGFGDSVILVINCCNLLPVTQGGLGDFSFSTNKRQGHGGAFVLGGGGGVAGFYLVPWVFPQHLLVCLVPGRWR